MLPSKKVSLYLKTSKLHLKCVDKSLCFTYELQDVMNCKILTILSVSITFMYTHACAHTHIVHHCPEWTGSNGCLNEESRGLVLLQLMPPERWLLCGGRPLNTELEAGALEITVLRVSEIAPAILIMSPTLIPYVHWLQAPRERKRERERERERERRLT